MATPDEFQFIPRPPREPLARHVDTLWYASGRIHYAHDQILPTGHAVLLVNLGDPQRTGTLGQEEVQTEAWVVGSQSGPTRNAPLGATHVLGASLGPTGIPTLVGVPAHELSDRVIALDGIWGRWISELRERAAEQTSPDEALGLFERLLTDRVTVDARLDRRLSAAVNAIARGQSVARVSRELDMTDRHLRRLFEEHVGLAPRVFGRVSRLNRLLEDVDPGSRRVDWADLAYAHGYYDQPHFNRDFASLAGMTPGDYLRRRADAFGPDLGRGENVCFVPSF